MPLVFVCKECGEILFISEKVVSSMKARIKVNGRCPKCKRKLDLSPSALTISSVSS